MKRYITASKAQAKYFFPADQIFEFETMCESYAKKCIESLSLWLRAVVSTRMYQTKIVMLITYIQSIPTAESKTRAGFARGRHSDRSTSSLLWKSG